MFYIQKGSSKIYFDATENYGAVCPKCGKEFLLADDEFESVTEDGGVYGCAVYCEKCSAENESEKVVEFPKG